MPARRKKRRVVLSTENLKKPRRLKAIVVGFLFLLALIFIRGLFFNKNWTNDKTVLAVQEQVGDVSILLFDASNSEITKIKIPGTLSVEASKNLGVWKLGSIWQLGAKNGGSGDLLTRTITSHLKFPVYLYAKGSSEKMVSSNPFVVFTSFGSPFETNLTIGDKLSIALFAMKVKNVDRKEIDLIQTQLIKKSTLADGEEGYVISSAASPGIYSLFISSAFSESNLKVAIKDGSERNIAKVIASAIDVLGGRVLNVRNESVEGNCEVLTAEKEAGALLSKVFRCELTPHNPQDNYDIEIRLGKDYKG